VTADFNKPINTTPYLTVWDYVEDNIALVATWFEDVTGATNIPTNAKRFSTTNKRFEYWSGATWLELLSKATTAYDIRAAVADLADLATNATTAGACTGNSATADLADNSLSLGGALASTYTQNTDVRAILYGGTGASTQANARTNLSVYSKSDSDARYLLESNNLSDLNSPPTARTNISVYSKLEIETHTYGATDHTIAPFTTTAIAAPSGYRYTDMVFNEDSFDRNAPGYEWIVFVSINSTGTSVSVKNKNIVYSSKVTIVWEKRG